MVDLLDLPYNIFHTLYRSAWMESIQRQKEAEEQDKKIKKEAMMNKSSNNRKVPSRKQLESIYKDNLPLDNIPSDELDDIIDDI